MLHSNHPFPKNTENRPGMANRTIFFLECFQHQHPLGTQQFCYFTVLALQSSTPKEPYPVHAGHNRSKLMVWWKGVQTCSQTPNVTSDAGPAALHSSPSSHQTSCSALPFGSHRDLPVVDPKLPWEGRECLMPKLLLTEAKKTCSQHTKLAERTVSRTETSSGTSDP